MKVSMQIKKNILLLGGNGFIGKNIIAHFKNNDAFSNYRIVVLSRKIQVKKEEGVIYEIGDYGNKEILDALFSKWRFAKVFHLASSSVPISSNNNILDDLNGNLIATIGLLEVMRNHNCTYIMYLSSGGAVYGTKNIHAISEKELCSPISSYGIVKLTIENYLKVYQKLYGINYLILRISNPFGAFHESEIQGVINIAIRRAIKGQLLEVWGNGSQSKDYIFMDDLIRIIIKLVENNILNKTINVGSGKSHPLNAILGEIKLILPEFKINYIESKPTDIKDFCLDISLLKSLIDFEFTAFEEAIRKTIMYEKSNYSNL
jgi:UDP-glucose 4-epimerase